MIFKQNIKEWLLILLNLPLYLISLCLWAIITILMSGLSYHLFRLMSVLIAMIFAIFLMILTARTIRSWRRWLGTLPIQVLLVLLFFGILDWNSIVKSPVYYPCLIIAPCLIHALGLAVKWAWKRLSK